MRSVSQNSLINIFGASLPIVVVIFTVPIYINTLGVGQYGLVLIFWTILGFASFLDLGFGRAASYFLAKLSTDTENNAVNEIFWSSLIVAFVVGCTIAVIFSMVLTVTPNGILESRTIPLEENVQAIVYLIFVLPFLLSFPTLIGSLEGKNLFATSNLLSVTHSASLQVVPLLAAIFVEASVDIVILFAVLVRIFFFFVALFVCIKALKLSGSPRFRVGRVLKLFKYGSAVSISSFTTPILETLDRLIIGGLLGTQSVSFYAVPQQILMRLRIIPHSIMRAAFPILAKSSTAGALSLSTTSAYITIFIITPLLLAFVLFSRMGLSIWVGEDFATESYLSANILVLGIIANAAATASVFKILSSGYPGVLAKLHLIEILPYSVTLVLFAWWFGIEGAAAAWSLRSILDMVIVNHLAKFPFDITLTIFTPIVFTILLIVAQQHLGDAHQWITLLISLIFVMLFSTYGLILLRSKTKMV